MKRAAPFSNSKARRRKFETPLSLRRNSVVIVGKIGCAESENTNANWLRVPDEQRRDYLKRWAREHALAPSAPHILRDLTRRLARQVRGKRIPRESIGADAAAIVRLGRRARHAVAYDRSAARYFDAAEALLKPYRAEVARRADPLGVAMGVRFATTEPAEHERVFFVA